MVSAPVFLIPLWKLRSREGVSDSIRLQRGYRRLTNLEIMLVRQRVLDSLNVWHCLQNVLAHLIHGILHGWAVLLRKQLHRNFTCSRPRLVELWNGSPHRSQTLEVVPLPRAIDLGGQNPVPDFRESGVLITDEAVELRASALQDQQSSDAAANFDALSFPGSNFNVPRLVSITEERVGVGLPIQSHTGPAMDYDLHVSSMDMLIRVDEVRGEDAGVELRGSHRVLFCLDVDGVLD